MSSRLVRFGVALALGVAALPVAQSASANGLEIPENGTEVMGRAGAWTARADNPLAAALNPAGLAGQASGFVINANVTYQKMCFARAGNYPSGGVTTNTNFGSNFYDKPYPEVCKKNGVGDLNVVPQLGFNYAVNSKLSIGVLPLWTPSGTGKADFPLTVNFDGSPATEPGQNTAPAPQRFMLVSRGARIIMPTFGFGYEVAKGLRIGASFQWVITMFNSAVSSQGTQASAQDRDQGPASSTRSEVKWNQWFTPAAVLGAMFSPHEDVDIGAMFRYSADIVKRGGEVTVTAPVYGKATNAQSTPANTTVKLEEFRIPQPWEVRAGVRWHPRRKEIELPKEGRRDFLKHDKFDIELDVIYAHNSAFDKLTILFAPGQFIAFGNTLRASEVPRDASIPKAWKNTVEVRLGGEFAAIPDKLGIRAGTFFRTAGQDEQYLNLDFHPGQMFGFYLGATLRLSKVVDLAAGYGHIFVKDFTTNDGKVRALVGTAPDLPNNRYSTCPDEPTPAYRSCTVVNNGRLSSSYNIFSVGTTLHF